MASSHVMEGQSDREGVTKLNRRVTDSLQKRLQLRLRRRWCDEDGETNSATEMKRQRERRWRWRDEDGATEMA